jgi:hypothetical protein
MAPALIQVRDMWAGHARHHLAQAKAIAGFSRVLGEVGSKALASEMDKVRCAAGHALAAHQEHRRRVATLAVRHG